MTMRAPACMRPLAVLDRHGVFVGYASLFNRRDAAGDVVMPGASGRPLTGSLAEPAKAGTAKANTEMAIRSKRDLVKVFDIVGIPFLCRSFTYHFQRFSSATAHISPFRQTCT